MPPTLRPSRPLLAASAALVIAASLIACGDGTFSNELPVYDASFGDIDSSTPPAPDAGPTADASDASPATDASDAGDASPVTLDAGDGGAHDAAAHDGGDAAIDAAADAH